MPSTGPTPAPALQLVEQTAALVRQRAARLDRDPAPSPKATVFLDEAATVLASVSPARDLVADLLRSGRAIGVREPQQLKRGRQYASLAELTAAAERGEL